MSSQIEADEIDFAKAFRGMGSLMLSDRHNGRPNERPQSRVAVGWGISDDKQLEAAEAPPSSPLEVLQGKLQEIFAVMASKVPSIELEFGERVPDSADTPITSEYRTVSQALLHGPGDTKFLTIEQGNRGGTADYFRVVITNLGEPNPDPTHVINVNFNHVGQIDNWRVDFIAARKNRVLFAKLKVAESLPLTPCFRREAVLVVLGDVVEGMLMSGTRSELDQLTL